MTGNEIRAAKLLLGRENILEALAGNVMLQVSRQPGPAGSIGTVVAAAAQDSAYRSYSGSLRVEDTDKPIAVGMLALVFADTATSERTFAQVAAAAHLRTKLGECSVAVETVTSANGLVSYWSFLSLRECLVILTLDTTDPQTISMTAFRSLVSAAVRRMEESTGVAQ